MMTLYRTTLNVFLVMYCLTGVMVNNHHVQAQTNSALRGRMSSHTSRDNVNRILGGDFEPDGLDGPQLSSDLDAIVGGFPAPVGEFPFSVQWNRRCGGSLIYEDVVLSAAHCAHDASTTVWVGGVEDKQGIERQVQSQVTHPLYNSANYEAYDFMILTLDEPVHAEPVVLSSSLNEDPNSGDSLLIMGFGYTSESGEGGTSKDLLEAEVHMIGSCGLYYGSDVADPTYQFCAAAEEGGADACLGDGGGPLVDENHMQVGVVSWGRGCARAEYPGVYARVSQVYPWLQSMICTYAANPPPGCVAVAISVLYQGASTEHISWTIQDEEGRVVAMSTSVDVTEQGIATVNVHLLEGFYKLFLNDDLGQGLGAAGLVKIFDGVQIETFFTPAYFVEEEFDFRAQTHMPSQSPTALDSQPTTDTPSSSPTTTPSGSPSSAPSSTPSSTSSSTPSSEPTVITLKQLPESETPLPSETDTPVDEASDIPTDALSSSPTASPSVAATETDSVDVTETETEANTFMDTLEDTEDNTPAATEEITEAGTSEDTEEATEGSTPENTEDVTEESTPEETGEVTEESTPEETGEVTETTTEDSTEEETEAPSDISTVKETEAATSANSEEDSEEPDVSSVRSAPTDVSVIPTAAPTSTSGEADDTIMLQVEIEYMLQTYQQISWFLERVDGGKKELLYWKVKPSVFPGFHEFDIELEKGAEYSFMILDDEPMHSMQVPMKFELVLKRGNDYKLIKAYDGLISPSVEVLFTADGVVHQEKKMD